MLNLIRFSASTVFGFALVLSCASPPAPVPVPAPEAAEPPPVVQFGPAAAAAVDFDTVRLETSLRVANPGKRPISVEGVSARLVADGGEPAPVELSETLVVAGGDSAAVPLSFTVRVGTGTGPAAPDAAALGSGAVPWSLAAVLRGRDGEGKAIELSASGSGSFPRVRRPVFEILSIKIKRAELINTRLKVTLRISNPNDFDLAFRSISYELFGEGRFWADGVVAQPTPVPGGGHTDIDLALVMNFINMKRELLDQVIKMERVRYRFKGEASADTETGFLPTFTMAFDRADSSEVIE